LVANAGRQIGKGLDQPLDVRVVDAFGRHPQPASDPWVLARKLGAELANIDQLAVIKRKKLVAHEAAPRTANTPEDGSSTESNNTRSSIGSTTRTASMRNFKWRSTRSGASESSTRTSRRRGSNLAIAASIA